MRRRKKIAAAGAGDLVFAPLGIGEVQNGIKEVNSFRSVGNRTKMVHADKRGGGRRRGQTAVGGVVAESLHPQTQKAPAPRNLLGW